MIQLQAPISSCFLIKACTIIRNHSLTDMKWPSEHWDLLAQNEGKHNFDYDNHPDRYITSAFSHQENCRRYVVVTQPSSDPTHTCNITLNQLIVLQNDPNRFLIRHFITRPMRMEIMFQSGVHQVAEMAGCQPLPFTYFDKVVIKGQPNVTIDYLSRVFIYFGNVPKFMIQNMNFQNCNCHQGFGIVFNTMNLGISAAAIHNSKFANSRLAILNNWNNCEITKRNYSN